MLFVCEYVSVWVSAITSSARTGTKVYYQSGPGLVPVGPMAAVDIGTLAALRRPMSTPPIKMTLTLTRTTEP